MTYFVTEISNEVCKYSLHERTVNLKNGVKVDGSFEYIDYGDFYVKTQEDIIEKGISKYTCYDMMIKFMVDYQPLELVYPCTLLDYVQGICSACGVPLYSTDFFNNNLEIEQDYYEGLNYTYRDILEEVAQVTCSTLFIKESKLYFSGLNDTDEILTPDNMKSLKINDILKPVNSLVLSRTPQEDNIYSKDDVSIAENGLSEIKFENNQIIDKRREDVIDAMFNQIKGISFYGFECENIGMLTLDYCDKFKVQDLSGQQYDVVMFNSTVNITTGIAEKLNTAITQSTTQYKYATDSQKRLSKAEIVVDKQNNTISMLVSDVDEIGDDVEKAKDQISDLETNQNENNESTSQELEQIKSSITEIKQTSEDIKIQISKGSSQVKTSTGFTFNDEGMNVSKSDSEMSTQITEDGMKVSKNEEVTLNANNQGVDAKNLRATTFLIVGDNSRLQDYLKVRTGVFWIGD